MAPGLVSGKATANKLRLRKLALTALNPHRGRQKSDPLHQLASGLQTGQNWDVRSQFESLKHVRPMLPSFSLLRRSAARK
jgi:hypothetical protein